MKCSSFQLSQLKLSVRLKQAILVTRVHGLFCAATFTVLSDYSIINVFRVSLLPLPTSSAISAVCNTQAKCNPVPLFRLASNLLKCTILPQNLLLLWNIRGVNTNIFSQISHTQYIGRDETGDMFWLIKPSSGLYRREMSTFTR